MSNPYSKSSEAIPRVGRTPPPVTRSPLVSRRSEERSLPPRFIRRGSDQRPIGSVYSGREGSVYGGRKEVLAGPLDEDLHLFARHCKAFYFSLDPPEESSRFISSTLATLPPTHRPAYTRVQSSLRSHAHLHHLRLRVSTFHALLSSLTTSGSLSPSCRLDLGSASAQAERLHRIQAFAKKWSAGTEPFFRGLWAVLRLQSRGEGGAGGHRVVWEVDDAVFQESGGPDFMHEAVTILKGVLGFADQALTTPPRLRRVRTLPRDNSSRATSDPFEERRNSEDRPLLADDELDNEDIASEEVELNKPRFRLWVFPAHINDEEAEALMGALPRQRKDARFPFIRPGRGAKAAEEAAWRGITVEGDVVMVPRLELEEQEGVVREGTGRAWTGLDARSFGWQGSRWFRFIRWWKRLFRLARF